MPSIDAVFQFYRDRGWDRPAPTPTPAPPVTGLAAHLAAADRASQEGRLYNPAPAPEPPKPQGTFERRQTEADQFADSGITRYQGNDFAGAKADLQKAKELGGSRFSPEELDRMLEQVDQIQSAATKKGIQL